MARQLIADMTGDWQPDRHADTFTEAVQALVARRVAAGQTEAVEPMEDATPGPGNVFEMNVMEFHTWNARTNTIEKPDRMVFDLDPGEGVAWPQVREGAELTRALLQQLELQCWLKTSGGKGLHVVVPLAARHTWPTVIGLSRAVVAHLAQVIPDRFVAKPGPAHRVGKIFVDYLRNHRGATTVAAYSARARPGLGSPCPWPGTTCTA